MVFGDRGIIPSGLGWSPILSNHVLLTIWIDKSMGKEGNRHNMEFSWVLDDWLSGLFL
jgi:hypothetical protein